MSLLCLYCARVLGEKDDKGSGCRQYEQMLVFLGGRSF
jgi:hypothetical protein